MRFFLYFSLLFLWLGSSSWINQTNTLTSSLSINKKTLPVDWHHKDYAADSIWGISTERAYQFLKQTKRVPQPVLVAVIDAGIDIKHPDLAPSIWVNPKEIAGNAKDDDYNGYVDDVSGWNFLGVKNSTEHLLSVGTEEFREYKRLRPSYEHLSPDSIALLSGSKKEEYAYFLKVRKKAGISSYLVFTEYLANIAYGFVLTDSLLHAQFPDKEHSLQDIAALQVDSTLEMALQVAQGKSFMYKPTALWKDVFEKNISDYLLAQNRIASLDSTSSPRDILQDQVHILEDSYYGNNNVEIDTYHGTFVAGIIAAQRANQQGIDGIADAVKILPIRAVPEGDEYDKDIALAIRYAVDMGAKVINLSFGKYLSPNHKWVDEALQYAEKRDVVLVHAAGNDGLNIDTIDYYPSGLSPRKEKINSFIRVGVSNAAGDPADGFNFGKNKVDILAPGVSISSIGGESEVSSSNGSSVAAPMVSGVAALLRSYYPDLSARQIKQIILASSAKIDPDKPIYLSKAKREINSSEFCATAGIVNAYQAVVSAEKMQLQVNFDFAERMTDSYLRNQASVSVDIYPSWIGKTEAFYYTENNQGKVLHYLVLPEKKKKELLFDAENLFKQLSELSQQSYNPYKETLRGISFDSKNFSYFYFKQNGKRYKYHRKTKLLSLAVEEDNPKPKQSRPSTRGFSSVKYSADSSYYTFSYLHDLYIQKTTDSVAVRLTEDGEAYYSFAANAAGKKGSSQGVALRLTGDSSSATHTAGKKGEVQTPPCKPQEKTIVLADSEKDFPAGYWANNSKHYFVLREDKRAVAEMGLIKSLAMPRPTIETYKFPIPGDKEVVQYQLYLFDAQTGTGKQIDVSKYPDQKLELADSYYKQEPRYVYFYRKSRTCDKIDLCRLDTETGSFTEVISEECSPHYNVQMFTSHLIEGGKDILWWSERTGYGKYYRYDFDGKLQNLITTGNFVAGKILSIDSIARTIIYEAFGGTGTSNPSYKRYFKSDFEGKKTTLLTPGDGSHDIALSPGKKHLIDTYSRVDKAPVSSVRDLQGKELVDLGERNLQPLFDLSYSFPLSVCLKAADDSTLLYGVMYLPSRLDTTKKYPIISNVYPGPQDDFIPRKFSIDDNYNQSLAELGFVVINVAPRGSSPLRGRDFHCFGYNNLRDYALADDKYVIEQLAARYSFIDLDRVGIYGHSGGGFMSTAALLTYPNFYKVAVSASGNHDNTIYTQWWGETYQGVCLQEKKQTKDKPAYEFTVNIPTNLELADNLQGRLLLITGDEDKNVHPAHTFRMANALIKNNKRFDMMVLPGKDHGLGDQYYVNLIRYYFVENLLNQKQAHINLVEHQ